MKITHIATAAVLPAAVAGAAISLAATSHAAPRHTASPAPKHSANVAPARATAAQDAQTASSGGQSATHIWVTVRAGQTLSGIATAHHMSWQAIYATPPNTRVVHDPGVLTVGERLRIPADPRLRAAQFDQKYAAGLRQEAAAAPAAAAPAGAGEDSGAALTAGESSFEQCVAWRESSDTPTDPDGLFGILPATWQSLGYSGTAGEASVAVQKEAFARLYAEDGTAPWAPYDGC
jgi:LysM domain